MRDRYVTHALEAADDGVKASLASRARRRWRTFPFWYTVLALSELESGDAKAELKYAAPVLERAAHRPVRRSPVYGRRRQELAARVLDHL